MKMNGKMRLPPESQFAVAAWFVGVIGAFLVMLGLVWTMCHYIRPAPADQAQVAERRKKLAELNAAAKEQLDNYAWINRTKGLVRLPISRAMELTLQEWQEPASARSNLIARVEGATAPPPKPPEKPNPYE
jgi:hypothetical protein